MDARFVAVAIPIFFLAIGVELWVARRRNLRVYRFADAVGALSCGIVSQALGVFTILLTTAAYVGIQERFGLTTLGGWPAWLGAIVAVDFVYYWWHRASHRVSILWVGHAAHHQSEDYNLAVALRQTAWSSLTASPFYWALAVAGFPPKIVGSAIALNTLYQFWIHTRLVGKLGPLEWVLNTPSHHRVHHGIDPWAIDKNYAGMLIVWDRLFGTFEYERHEPTYGVVEGFPSANPVWANLAPLVKIARNAGSSRGLDRLRAVFGPPEWTPAGPVVIPEPTRGYRWDPPTNPRAARIVASWFVLVIGALLWLITRPADAASLAVAAAIIGSTVVWSKMLGVPPPGGGGPTAGRDSGGGP